MRGNRWISVLAAVGVLVHAVAVARHATALAGATLQHLELRADLAQLCRGGAGQHAAPASDLPYIPRPVEGQNDCQLCCSLGSAAALPAPEGASLALPRPAAVVASCASYRAPQPPHAACPPARGPPVLA